jgi:hypothetical protein
MVFVLVIKSLCSFKCVWFDAFGRPMSRQMLGTKILNDFNVTNQIAISFGAVFIRS